jgi:hypothetical protein
VTAVDSADIKKLLVEGPHPFETKHVTSLLNHYEALVDHFRVNEWDDCAAKGGKFVEAVVKALGAAAHVPVGKGRAFKVGTVINGLNGLAQGAVDEGIRITIPRCCQFIYDIASNRGGRHDAEEVNPNEMDAAAAVANASWVLAEMIRIAQKDAVDLGAAKEMVESLTERKYALVEVVDGRFYFLKKKKSGSEVAVVALATSHPTRIPREELVETVRRNGFSVNNARMAVSRLAGLVDDDGVGNLRLLATGRQKADEIMSAARGKGH